MFHFQSCFSLNISVNPVTIISGDEEFNDMMGKGKLNCAPTRCMLLHRAQMCTATFYNCETEISKPVTRYKYLPVCHMDSHNVLSYWNIYELHTVSAAQIMITDMLFQHIMPGNLYKLKVIWDNPPLCIIYNISIFYFSHIYGYPTSEYCSN